jgi:hypothetical protein
MESSRKYPRSLEQAFGPYTARRIDVEPPRSSLRAWAVYLAILALAIAGAMLAGCTKVEAAVPDGMMGETWRGISRTTPDDYGVICYRSNASRYLSCVKVK